MYQSPPFPSQVDVDNAVHTSIITSEVTANTMTHADVVKYLLDSVSHRTFGS